MKTSTYPKALMIWPALLLNLLFVPRLALAGPPFLTDDPEPVDYQHHELYIATQMTKTTDGKTGTLPQIEYNYGAAPSLQVHLIVPYAFSDPKGGSWNSGLGDIEFGLKYRFLQETEYLPMAGFFPIVVTSSGDEKKGLGNGSAQLFLPLWLQKSWGDWKTYGGGGYWINNATDAKNHWFLGWLLQKDLSEHLTLGGEIFYKSEEIKGEGDSSGFNVGGTYNINEGNHVLFSVGRGLTNISATNEFSAYLGYQWTW